MNGIIIAIIVILNFILQSTVFQYIAILGIKPDTALIIVVSFGIILGKKSGSFVGIAAGLLQDIVFGSPVGVTTLVYFLTGYIAGENSNRVFKEHAVVPLIFTASATILKYIIGMFFGYALGIEPPAVTYMIRYLPVETIYNCLFSLIIYRLLFILSKRNEEISLLTKVRKRQ